MKATGVVRRIDDLGRVVIPKEIRRAIGIREGDPLEICVERNRVVLRKYSYDLIDEVQIIREQVIENFLPPRRYGILNALDTVVALIKESAEDEDEE